MRLIEADLPPVGDGSLGHSRSFRHRLVEDFEGPIGLNWQIEQWPNLVDVNGDQSELILMTTGNRSFYFDDVGGSYELRHGSGEQLRLEHDATNDVYVLTSVGNHATVEFEFGDFDQTATPPGLFLKRTGTSGIVTEVLSYYDTLIAEVQQTITTGGVTTVYSIQYDYYAAGANVDRMEQVTLRKRVDSDPWEPIRRVSYDYYGDLESHGSLNDLKTATVQVPDGSGGWDDTQVTYYRYYQGTHSGSNPGREHLLKYKLGPEGWRRLQADSVNPLTATDVQIAAVADYYFEYDDEDRITERVAAPWCGCSSGSGGGETFEREKNPLYPAEPDDPYNAWEWKVTRSFPDGNREVVYTNTYGSVMLRVFQEMDGETVLNEWPTFYQMDDRGRVAMQAETSAISGYDEAELDLMEWNDVADKYVYLNDSSGLIHLITYYDATGVGVDETTSGGVEGYLRARYVQEGETGTSIKTREFTYFKREAGDEVVYPVAEEILYPDASDANVTIVTAYSYQWTTGTIQIEERQTTLPAVATSQNGTGTSASITEVYDDQGRVIWHRDERGVITHFDREPLSGRVLQRIDDVDTTLVTAPTGWSTPTGDGFGNHAVTDMQHDVLGRLTRTLGPQHEAVVDGNARDVRHATWLVYHENAPDELDETWTGSGFVNLTASTEHLVEPVSISRRDKTGRGHESIQSVRTTGSGALAATDTFDRADWTAWSANEFSTGGELTAVRQYHAIPASGDGVEGTNYDKSRFEEHPDFEERMRSVSPGGTITRQVFDARQRVVETWLGTDDSGATADDPTGGSATGNNMVLVEEHEYDGGGVGDGNLTEVTQHVDATTTRVTSFAYDFRGRRTSETGEIDHYAEHSYDNLNRLIQTDRRDTDDTGNLIGRSEKMYDDRGRVYRQITHEVDPDTGTVGNSLTADTWYDDGGRPIKTIGADSGEAFTKTHYDGLGRATALYVGYHDGTGDDDPHAADLGLSDDILAEQVEFIYDVTGNPLLATSYQRHHDDTTTKDELDNSFALRSYQASWYDGAGRPTARANYGTNGGGAVTRPATPPAASDTVLVSLTDYDTAGRAHRVTDSAGIVTATWFDDLSRPTHVVENYDSTGALWTSEPADPAARDSDVNRITATTYSPNGQVATLTAIDPDHDGGESDNQTTTYVYGTTLTDSDVAHAGLMRAIIYPDSDDPADLSGDGTDAVYERVELAYNRRGELTQRKDQREVVHAFDYDALGRLTHDRVTSLGRGGENVDGTVRRISRSYEVRGMLESVTSYDDASTSAGSVLNEVDMAYNGFGQLVSDSQAHAGSVGGTTPKVQYSYAAGSDNHVRATSLTYPDGQQIDYAYGASGSLDDQIHRIATIDDGVTTLATYQYLGTGTVIEIDHPEPDVKLDLFGGTSGTYAGFDRFGRIVDQRWHDYDTPADLVRHQHGYDRASNRLYRGDVVGSRQDEFHTNDQLHRLVGVQRGTLNATHDAISGGTLDFQQNWDLDGLGNWAAFDEDDDGDATWDLEQTRTHSDANEITGITNTTGSAWHTPAHDAAGNVIEMPQPNEPGEGFEAVYDAWNRLVELEEEVMLATVSVAEYQWDGMGRRILKSTYASGVLDETRHFYYSQGHQILEERVDGTADADVQLQYIWGLRYVDELILRDRDTNGDGTVDQRHYALQDANYRVTAIVGDAGTVVERYRYSPYGQRTVLNADFTLHTDPLNGSYSFAMGHQGLMHDGESGLVYNRARMLHPTLGRFVQRDPFNKNEPGGGYQDGMNRYQYVGSSPATSRDPDGLMVVTPPMPELPEPSPPRSYIPPHIGNSLCLKAVSGKLKRDSEACERQVDRGERDCDQRFHGDDSGWRRCMFRVLTDGIACSNKAINDALDGMDSCDCRYPLPDSPPPPSGPPVPDEPGLV